MALSAQICWCGCARLSPFNADYLRCESCHTLICHSPPAPGDPRRDDALYGKDYWFSHQQESYGLGDIQQRSRTDLPERNIFWLNQLLRHKLPPGNALEIGSAHGGFVYLLEQAGFDATGLELSPAICDFATQSFGIPMLCGPVQEQNLAPGCFDVIAMMDVLEHLPDPLATMRKCVSLLKPDGVLLIQTPKYPAPKSFSELAATQDRFLAHLNPVEHTVLFNRKSLHNLLVAAGAPHAEHVPAIFGFYDMFTLASPSPLATILPRQRDQWLEQTPRRRMVRALLDAEDRFRNLVRKYRDLKRGLNEETLFAAA